MYINYGVGFLIVDIFLRKEEIEKRWFFESRYFVWEEEIDNGLIYC